MGATISPSYGSGGTALSASGTIEESASMALGKIVKIVSVVSGVTFPECRALSVDVGADADLVMPDASTVTAYALQQGYNPIACTKVTFTGIRVWALY